MVSSISSSQLLAQQAALKALQGSDTGSSTTSGSATTTAANSATSSLLSALDGSSSTDSSSSYSSLADIFSSTSSDDSDDDASIFTALIAQVKQQIASLQGTTGSDGSTSATGATGSATDGSTSDVSSTAFMTSLKQRIEALQKSPETKDVGDSMMKALDAGTLTVTDATSGKEITAWDPDNSDATASTATTIDQTDWSSFLKEHLARDSDGRYSRNADDSQVDKVTGDSSYFGMINDNYYYLSWTGASSDASTAAATTSTDSTSA
jgi:hypothetical protein